MCNSVSIGLKPRKVVRMKNDSVYFRVLTIRSYFPLPVEKDSKKKEIDRVGE